MIKLVQRLVINHGEVRLDNKAATVAVLFSTSDGLLPDKNRICARSDESVGGSRAVPFSQTAAHKRDLLPSLRWLCLRSSCCGWVFVGRGSSLTEILKNAPTGRKQTPIE